MRPQDLVYLLKELQALPKECEWVEFKVNNHNPQEIGELLSALSNSACYNNQKFGYLVFGVEDVTHRFVGTVFRPSVEKKGNQELENWLATQLNPRIDFNIFEFEYEGNHFAIFRIEATRNTPVSFRGEAYIRVGSYKKLLDEHPEKERKIWNKDNIHVFEREISLENVDETQVLSLIDYPAYFDLIKFPLPDNRKGILERLTNDKIVIPQTNGKYNITNLGAILLSKEIESFDNVSRKTVRVVIYDGKNRLKTIKEQIGKKGYAVGFDGLINFIANQTPTHEVIEGALRKQISQYPILAIRELVANAIIHQDFSVKGTSPMVEVFSDRIEITNPGKPLIDPLRFVDHSPESRNEILARFMRRLNICEERGSGMDKVIIECEKFKLPSPEIIVGDNYTRIILYGHKTFRDMDKSERVRTCYYHACLKYVSGEFMTNQTVRERFDITDENYPMASRIISDAIASGMVKDSEPDNKSKKYARYVPYWV
jgi:predicted HTH transcriptional regulator